MMDQSNTTGAIRQADDGGRLNRRLFFFKSLAGVATVAVGTAVVTAATVQPAQAQWCTDADPYDPQGRGIRCRRRRVGITDADPYDRVGRGIRCTDRDPYDPRGRGRWCRR
jgi:hypothetical protein